MRSESRATALLYLGEIAWKRGNREAALHYFDRAVSVPGLDPGLVRKLEARVKAR